MKSKKFDVIIFGASGCIGKCALFHAIEVLEGFYWAIAGKSLHKMQLVLDEISFKTGRNLRNVQIFVVNAHDVEELETVAAKCKVVINCCGPYYLLAENILASCIVKGTHYVDMCNDPYFNELMELKYHEKAVQHEVYIISSCGFHSFPIEMAMNFLKKNFEGTINSVEAFACYNLGGFLCWPLHSIWSVTAWLSLIWSCVKIKDLPIIREQLRLEFMPCLLPPLAIEYKIFIERCSELLKKKTINRELQHRSKYHENGIMVHFPFLDQQTVERSQYMFYARNNQRPIQFCKYIEFPSYLWAILFIIWCLFLSVFSQFQKTRKILKKYQKLFSFGIFSSKGPIPYRLEMSSYKIKMYAKGWSGKSMYPQIGQDDNSMIVDKYMNIEVSGENPFYYCGCIYLLLSAKTILVDQCKMPGRGGVFAPGYAFYNTKILERSLDFSNYFRLKIL